MLSGVPTSPRRVKPGKPLMRFSRLTILATGPIVFQDLLTLPLQSARKSVIARRYGPGLVLVGLGSAFGAWRLYTSRSQRLRK